MWLISLLDMNYSFGWGQTVALIIGLILIWYYYLTKDYGKWEAKGLFSIKPSFLFGNLKEVYLQQAHTMDFHRDFYEKMSGHR